MMTMVADEASDEAEVEQPYNRTASLTRLFDDNYVGLRKLVRHWAACEEAPYRDVGRPVVWDENGKFHVLDFTLERKGDGQRFVTEMK